MTREDGSVLVVVVLLTVAMVGLAHGLLVSARTAYGTARTHARVVELDARATGSLESELRRGWVPWMDSVAVGGARSVSAQPAGALRVDVTWRRLDREGWLVGAAARRGDGPAVGSRRLVWIFDPERRVAALPGVVSAAPGSQVAALGVIVPDGVPALGVVDAPALGLLDLGRLVGAGDTVGSVGTPTPVEVGGACDPDARWNWGDPTGPYRPCGDLFVVKSRVGALTVDGGAGQGVVVVDGDLVVRGGATLFGLVIASGRVEVVEGSRIEGRVVAYGGVVVDAGSSVVGSGARAARALAEAREKLGAALALHPAARLGPE